MSELRYTSRGMRRRRETDKWEVTLSHNNPITGETVRTFHTIEAKTERQARKKRDELSLDLERKGGALASSLTLKDFLTRFVVYKHESGTIEPSTVRGYRAEASTISRYIGDVRLGGLTIADVNDFMARMSADGYAPKSVSSAPSRSRATPTSSSPPCGPRPRARSPRSAR